MCCELRKRDIKPHSQSIRQHSQQTTMGMEMKKLAYVQCSIKTQIWNETPFMSNNLLRFGSQASLL